MPNKADKDLIAGILSNDAKTRRKALSHIYQANYAHVKSMILKLGGTLEVAEDIFQEGVSILYQNLKRSKFKAESSLNTYLFTICRYQFYNSIKKKEGQLVPLIDVPDDNGLSPEMIDPIKVTAIIKELKSGCQQILIAFYYENRSMSEIARMLGLGSDQAARNKKARCMKALMETIKNNKLTLESFMK